MAVYKILSQLDGNGNVNSIAQAQRTKILRDIKQKQYNKQTVELEKALNDFFYGKVGDTHDKYHHKAMKMAQEVFNDKYNKMFTFMGNKLTAKFIGGNLQFIKTNQFIGLDSKQKEQVIKKTIQDIENVISSGKITSNKIQQLLADVKKAQSCSNWNDAKTSANEIIASIFYGNKNVYGDAFEMPLTAFAALLDNGITATVDDLKKRIVGSDVSKSILDISHLDKNSRQKLQIKHTKKINDGLTLEYHNPTKDKVDVTLTFTDQPYNLSAKSYASIYNDIHILGGTPLTAPVLNLSSVDFVSHYLTQLYYDHSTSLEDLHSAIRLNILFMALSGMGQSSTQADTFVLNDKGHKKIYVRNIANIINYMVNENKWQSMKINDKSNGLIPDEPLRNYMRKNSKNPIVDMIGAMHQIKLYVSLKGTAVRDTSQT